MTKLSVLPLIIGIGLLSLGVLSASHFYEATFDSRSFMGSFPLGEHVVCLLHHGKKVGEGKLKSSSASGTNVHSEGELSISIKNTTLRAPYTLAFNSNGLDQLINATLKISHLDNEISFSAIRPSPIEITGAFKSSSKNVKHTITLQGPISLKRTGDIVSIHNASGDITNGLWSNIEMGIQYDSACSTRPLSSLVLESMKLYQFLSKKL